eukprot:7311467-Heterocapsa_arctica.AAC.1
MLRAPNKHVPIVRYWKELAWSQAGLSQDGYGWRPYRCARTSVPDKGVVHNNYGHQTAHNAGA